MEASEGRDDFIRAGLESFGVEADEVELAVMGAAHDLFWQPILELLSLDTSEAGHERAPDLAKAPPSER